MNISMMNTSQIADEYYYVGTGIVPHSVYIGSCIYMAIVFVIGLIANIGIFIIFISSPLVSSCVHTDKSWFSIPFFCSWRWTEIKLMWVPRIICKSPIYSPKYLQKSNIFSVPSYDGEPESW